MKKISAILLITLVIACAFCVFGACQPHVCQSKCPTCGKCTDASCTDAACKDKCEGHEKPQPDDYGTVTIADVKVFITSNNNKTSVKIQPLFSKPDKAEDLTYSGFDTRYISIENGIVKPVFKRSGKHEVTAASEHFSAKFNVDVEYVNFANDEYYNYSDRFGGNFTAMGSRCASDVKDTTTVLIGDSFMDDQFIGEFMQSYSQHHDVVNAGISSTTSCHWEAAFKKVLGTTTPKNIAIHIGTNNFYDAGMSTADVEQSLQNLLQYIHEAYPTANIYWFNITQRVKIGYKTQVAEVNASMAAWCDANDWVTCVDTCSVLTTDKLTDEIHPKTESYQLMLDALVAAGCEITAK